MKLQILNQDLLEGMNRLKAVVPSKATLPILEHVLLSGGGELTQVIEDCLFLGSGADLLEGGDGHCGEEADDDDHDHDFDEGESLFRFLIHSRLQFV